MITTIYGNPKCPYCRCNECTMGYGDFFCPTCGATFTRGLAGVMEVLKPEVRAERIGRYHALHNWDYLWCVPEFTREELRAYANGFLSSAYTSGNTMAVWLYEAQAQQDASWREPGERVGFFAWLLGR